MTPRRPLVRRRDLAGLLAASGTAAIAAGCSMSRVPTSDQVPRDPLASLDEARWDGRTLADVLALPLTGEVSEFEAWTGLGPEDAAVDPVRQALTDFLAAAYLSPDALHGLDDAAARARIDGAAPTYWQDVLHQAWDSGERHLYAFTLAEGFATIGRPALAMDWFRGQREGTALLLLGGTLAWSVLETSTHAVGVIAYRVGVVADLAADGTASTATIRVTIHGLDGCALRDHGGLVVPALGKDAEHRQAQQATMDTVIAAPRIRREDLLDPESAALNGDDATNVLCP
ncbi:hypothetical protein BH708_14895 [Brachybacterium sp. P6-10-X1]|uniref:hypothetical protein n=1 Tax=Brachybacterium sp. P6-10-X1 TaxID=1903186 RepID=UPI000971BC2E|nr:hypothetical protein [Brachybacterium sp. P6-10-X1]APX33785.1 hypothetical protein BH708_14895 [Brachybacterium sp. P6-10-X1]